MVKIDVPDGLGEAGERFYRQAMNEYPLEEGHDKARLYMACRCLDEIANDEGVVRLEGRFIQDRFHQVREHPAARAIRDNKTLFCRIIRELNLSDEGPESRPPGLKYK